MAVLRRICDSVLHAICVFLRPHTIFTFDDRGVTLLAFKLLAITSLRCSNMRLNSSDPRIRFSSGVLMLSIDCSSLSTALGTKGVRESELLNVVSGKESTTVIAWPLTRGRESSSLGSDRWGAEAGMPLVV
jgi:hypothetical protein